MSEIIEINGKKFEADEELIPLLQALNDVGLTTTKHCAGHEEGELAWVVIDMKNIEKTEIRRGPGRNELKIMWKR